VNLLRNEASALGIVLVDLDALMVELADRVAI
jgi:hypothetical protein